MQKLTYDQLQQLIHDEYKRMNIGIMPMDMLRENAHFTPRLIGELCSQYFVAGVLSTDSDDVAMIAHQYKCLNDTGVFDVQPED